MTIEVETVRRVFAHNEEAFLEVGTWPESPDCLELRATDSESANFFGNVSLIMSPEFARALGNVLLQSANEMENKTK